MQRYVCTNCGFWQQHFAPPTRCPVCEDVRHTPPDNGYTFRAPLEIDAQVRCAWREITPGVTMFWNAPRIGIGPSGYLVRHGDGNIFFEGIGWYSAAALDAIATLGGIRWWAASHPHAYGAAWQLQQRFAPDMLIHVADLAWTNALRVTWPLDARLELAPGLTLHHTGGHFDGHTVLYDASRRLLFAGDALKFEITDGVAVGISCHKAFNRQIPLSHAEVARYRDVFSSLDFTHCCTSFEYAPNADRSHALRLFDQHLAAKPFCSPIAITENRE
jgi:hypothetical protein